MKLWWRRYIVTCGLTANMVALTMLFFWGFTAMFPDQFAPTVKAETAVEMFIGFTVFFTLYETITTKWPGLLPKWLR